MDVTEPADRSAQVDSPRATPTARQRPTPEGRQAALVQMRALLQDPDLTPDMIARVILGILHKELNYGAWNTYRRDGPGAVLVDLRQLADGEVTKQYIAEDALGEMDVRDTPLAGLKEAMGTYEPRRELLVVVRQAAVVGCYRMNRRSGKIVALRAW
jgi:hypothetical protein